MGMMDKVKQAVRGKSGKLEQGIDKAVKQVDQRTKGKYGDKLSKGSAKLKEQARKLDDERREGPGTTGTTGADPTGTGHAPGGTTGTGPTGAGPTETGPIGTTPTGTTGPSTGAPPSGATGTGPTGSGDEPAGPTTERHEPPVV